MYRIEPGAKDRAINTPVTLDGKPARIVGKRDVWATVAQIDEPWHYHQWAWPAAIRIADNGGDFRS